jgi:hypothetical protein
LPICNCKGIDPIDLEGYVDKKAHYAGMAFFDPHPFVYPVMTVTPKNERIELELTVPSESKP